MEMAIFEPGLPGETSARCRSSRHLQFQTKNSPNVELFEEKGESKSEVNTRCFREHERRKEMMDSGVEVED
jgi:hypothetical protein